MFHDTSIPISEEDGDEDDDEDDEEGDEKDEDDGADEDGEDEDTEEFRTHVHESTKPANYLDASNAFLADTQLFTWNSSGKEYYIRGKKWARNEGYSDLDEKGFKWPRTFTGAESQAVNAAIWANIPGKGKNAKPTFKLVAIWSFSGGGNDYIMDNI